MASGLLFHVRRGCDTWPRGGSSNRRLNLGALGSGPDEIRWSTRSGFEGDWRSGSALRSHRRGHWFEPSIAHLEGPGQEHVWSTPSRRRTDYSSKVQQWVSIRLVNPGSLCERI